MATEETAGMPPMPPDDDAFAVRKGRFGPVRERAIAADHCSPHSARAGRTAAPPPASWQALLAPSKHPVHLYAMNTFRLQPALRRATRASLVLAALSLLAACGPPQTPQQRAAYEACRSQAERQFSLQDRSSLFQTDTSLTPYAAQSANFAPTQNLANQFAHRQMVEACLRGATGPAPVAPQGTTASPGN